MKCEVPGTVHVPEEEQSRGATPRGAKTLAVTVRAAARRRRRLGEQAVWMASPNLAKRPHEKGKDGLFKKGPGEIRFSTWKESESSSSSHAHNQF